MDYNTCARYIPVPKGDYNKWGHPFMKYGHAWEHYIQQGDIPIPKGWSDARDRDAFIETDIVACKKGNLKPEVVADTFDVPFAMVKHKWPAWFYRLYMQVYKEQV